MELVFSEKIFTNNLEDIISVGFCDNVENGLEYTMDMDILYLKYENFFIRLEAINNYSRLLIRIENEIHLDLHYLIDEDMRPAFSKLHNIIFKDGEMADVFIEKMLLYNIHDQNSNSLICDAMKMHLSSGQILFFDPTYYFGINVGDEKLQSTWEDQNKFYTATIIDSDSVWR